MDERVHRTVATYEQVAEEYADRHDDRAVVAHLVAGFLDALERDSSETSSADRRRILDVGCGPGWESATFADRGHDVVAFDLTARFLAQARAEVPAAHHVRGDMRTLPFATDSFDGLWACASLLHVPGEDVAPTLAEFRRVLADGGVALVAVQRPGIDDVRDGSGYEADRRHFERYEPADLRELFRAAAFDVLSVDTDEGWVAVTAESCPDGD